MRPRHKHHTGYSFCRWTYIYVYDIQFDVDIVLAWLSTATIQLSGARGDFLLLTWHAAASI